MAKRTNGEGSIRKRANGTWEAQYSAGYDENGKRIRRSIYGKTKGEVAAKLADIAQSIRKNEYIAPSETTVKSWTDEWLKNYLLKARESTKYQYEQYMRLYVLPEIGNVPIQKVTAPMIQGIISGKLKDGLSAKTVRNLHSIVHHCFQDALDMEIISRNPVKSRKELLPKATKKEMLILEGEAVESFLAEIQGKEFEELFYIDLFTGMREGEILGLSWDCIDFKNQTITIKQQLKRDSHIGEKNSQYIIDDTKTGNNRTIRPAPSVFPILKKVKKQQQENQLRNGSRFYNPSNLVFTDEIGQWINGRTLLKAFKKRVDAIGIPEMRFHDLRHTYAALSLQNGDDLYTVSKNLGHTNISTTANTYGHLTEKARTDSANRMDSFIRSLNVVGGK